MSDSTYSMHSVKFEDVKDLTTEEYFNGNQFSIDAFNKKYASKEGETYVQAVKRVCDYIAGCEATPELRKYWSDRWFSEIFNDWWHPAGSIMQGAGSGRNISSANCTTISLGALRDDEEWDSLEAIIKNGVYSVAKAAAYRQGLGIDVSRLRPAKMSVRNSSNESQGVTHWMKLIDSMGYYVGQLGRRPASLISLNCKHPDIVEFIKAKSDYTVIQNANISVQCTDDFYKAVNEDKDWVMTFDIPEVKKGQKVYVDAHSTDLDCKYDKLLNKYYYIAKRNRPAEHFERTIKARALLELIAKNMYANGEPGIQNIDIARKYSNSDYLDDPKAVYDPKIISTNACCVVGETKVLTTRGWLTIKEIFDLYSAGSKDLMAVSYNQATKTYEVKPIVNAWQQRNDKTVELTIEENGKTYHIECSADHKLMTRNRGYVAAENLTYEDYIVIYSDKLGRVTSFSHNNEIKPLYDIEIKDNHNFVVNDGVVIKNSEQYLSRDGLCVLASINAASFSVDTTVYEEQFSIIGPSINRFLDDVNEVELRDKTYATPHQRLGIEALRRTGAGFTNIAGWIFNKNLTYGTAEANKAVEHFMQRYNYHLYKSSIALGKEKGNFGLFNKEKFEKSPFIQRMMTLGLKFDTMRNVTCTSIAPSGTLSLQFRDLVLGYGIEPAFYLYFWKRTRISGKYEYYFCVPSVIRKFFASIGIPLPMSSDTIKDTWDGAKGKPIAKIIEDNRSRLGAKFSASSDVKASDKLELMSGVMKWCDSSISVTYMLPESATWKDVYDFILEARKKEVKSIAAFPEKKMYGIVSQEPFKDLAVQLTKGGTQIHPQNFCKEEEAELAKLTSTVAANGKIIKTNAPKRPKALNCDVHHITFTKQSTKFEYIVIVGLLNGDPYEVFVMNNGFLDKKYTKGLLTKKKSGIYTLAFDDDTKIDDVTKDTTESEDMFTRMVSMSLRHGADIVYVVDQLEKVETDPKLKMWSFSTAMARALKKYIKDGVAAKGACPVCGSPIVRHDGCRSCTSCNWTACE